MNLINAKKEKEDIYLEDIKIIVNGKEYTFWCFSELKYFMFKLKSRRK